MVLFDALLDSLRARKMVTEMEARETKDLYTLNLLLDEKADSLLTKEEAVYVNQLKSLLKSNSFKDIEYLEPPQSLEPFHSRIICFLVDHIL